MKLNKDNYNIWFISQLKTDFVNTELILVPWCASWPFSANSVWCVSCCLDPKAPASSAAPSTAAVWHVCKHTQTQRFSTFYQQKSEKATRAYRCIPKEHKQMLSCSWFMFSTVTSCLTTRRCRFKGLNGFVLHSPVGYTCSKLTEAPAICFQLPVAILVLSSASSTINTGKSTECT